MSFFEDVPGFSPVQFFEMSAECPYLRGTLKKDKAYLLPSTEELLSQEQFADMYVGWNLEKLSFLVDVHVPFQKSSDSDIQKSDSVELFIDTRDLKAKSVVSRFCHHFVFFPVQINHFYGKEITRFRGDDIHTLCHPEDLQVISRCEDRKYQLLIEIPAHCLYGYDPLSSSRLGFTYRINRYQGAPQHFALSSEEYIIEQQPSMWGTLKLMEQE